MLKTADQLLAEQVALHEQADQPIVQLAEHEKQRIENMPTLRDQFAMAALPALIELSGIRLASHEYYLYKTMETAAEHAYAIADAMLKEREK